MANNQPQFWLQVRKDYILENFDSLLSYLKNYSYTADDDHPDYNSTLKCMTELSEDIAAKINGTPYYQPLELDYEPRDILRLFCATILASEKSGHTPRKVIAALVDVFVKSGVNCKEPELLKLYDITLRNLLGYRLVSCGFSWSDLTSAFSLEILLIKFTNSRFLKPDNSPGRFIEHQGLFLVPPEGLPVIAPFNRHFFITGDHRPQITLQDFMQVQVPDSEYEKSPDFEALYSITRSILSAQEQMKESPRITPKRYDKGSEILIRIKEKNGYRVIAETVDPAYERVSGKVLLNIRDKRVAKVRVIERLKTGDFLMARLSGDPGFTFQIEDSFENFYRRFVAQYADHECRAVFSKDYMGGSEWITEEGFRVSIDDSKYDTLDFDQQEAINEAKENGNSIELRLYKQPPRMDRPTFFVYADVAEDVAESLDRPFRADEATAGLFDYWLKTVGEKSEEMMAKALANSGFQAADPQLCAPIISILAAVVGIGLSSCRLRLEYLTALAMLAKIMDRTKELAYIDHERRFLHQQVHFAQNRDLKPLSHNAVLDGNPEVERREKIIDTLRGYKKQQISTGLRPALSNTITEQEDALEKISTLVEASNSLVGIIDNLELNNIKQAIARTLSIEDEYVSILDDRTFYGSESISLEFKTSIVYPPANRRRFASAVADPDMQKWAVLKTVCGFLNSRSGGELLLGVNDAGYAVGLENDIAKLCELKYISTPDIDHYRTYLQYLLDVSFKESDKDVAPEEITRPNIDYLPEKNAEGLTIMRIKIKPYTRNVVELAAPADQRPKGVEAGYVRRSGRTVPISNALRAEILSYKD